MPIRRTDSRRTQDVTSSVPSPRLAACRRDAGDHRTQFGRLNRFGDVQLSRAARGGDLSIARTRSTRPRARSPHAPYRRAGRRCASRSPARARGPAGCVSSAPRRPRSRRPSPAPLQRGRLATSRPVQGSGDATDESATQNEHRQGHGIGHPGHLQFGHRDHTTKKARRSGSLERQTLCRREGAFSTRCSAANQQTVAFMPSYEMRIIRGACQPRTPLDPYQIRSVTSPLARSAPIDGLQPRGRCEGVSITATTVRFHRDG